MRLVNLAPTGSRFQATPRTGFTMVELMVAMALSLFLMAILSEAFAVSMDTFRGMRAIGDMQDSLEALALEDRGGQAAALAAAADGGDRAIAGQLALALG